MLFFRLLGFVFFFAAAGTAQANLSCRDFFTVALKNTTVNSDSLDPESILYQARQLWQDPTIEVMDVRFALLARKLISEQQIEERAQRIGHRISAPVRLMRQRRLQFGYALEKAGDGYAASKIYRGLWETYYISKAVLISYMRGEIKTRDQKLISEAKWLLPGLTEASQFKDLRKKVGFLFSDPRNPPSAEQILEIYDQIFARTNDEYRYANWYMNQLERTSESSTKLQSDLKYIRFRLSINELSKRFGLNFPSQAVLDSKKVDLELNQSRPQILIHWLKYSNEQQRKHSFWLVTKATVQEAAVKLTSYLPSFLREPVRWLLMLDYNSYVIHSHIERIEAVTLAREDVRLLVFEEILGSGTKETSEQFLETMARLSSDMKIWNGLKNQVATLAENHANYSILLKQMDAAEGKIDKLGWISKFHDLSTYDLYIGLLARGGATAAALSANWNELISWFTSTASTAIEFLPFL